MKRLVLSQGAVALLSLVLSACPSDPPPPPPDNTLDDFLPPPPSPTGEPQQVFAGVLSETNLAQERIDGPAAQGLPGDIFLRNDKIRVILQQPGRSMALIPSGGTIVDADIVRDSNDPLFDADGDATDGVGNDHWGESSLLLRLGRIIDVTEAQIVADGSGGGAALVRFFGKDSIDDFINIAGALPLPLPEALDPDGDLNLDVAVDYLLEPGDDFVQVRYTLFTADDRDVETSVGFFGDIGGVSEPFAPEINFGGAGFGDLAAGRVKPAPYAAIQAVNIAYGVIPFYLEPNTQLPNPDVVSLTVSISGGLAIAYDIIDLGGLLSDVFTTQGLRVPANAATTTGYDFVVGSPDIVTVESRYQELRKEVATTEVSGTVLGGSTPLANARVAVFSSVDDVLDNNENSLTVFSTRADGSFSGKLAPGSYLLVADAEGLLRAAPQRINVGSSAVTANFVLPEPAKISYTIEDVTDPLNPFATPAKISIVGDDSNPPDARFRDTKASSQVGHAAGILAIRHSRSGASATDPEGAIAIEPGRYRVVVSRGMEYDRQEFVIDAVSGQENNIIASLTRVVDTSSYIKGDFHQHAINSPDAPVDLESRAITHATEGTEFFASTDHDFRTDYEPVINKLGLDTFVDSIVGEEVTTFDYGHFNAFPFVVNPELPNNGALDWGRGTEFLNLLPSEIFAALRNDGARVVQINHPRVSGGTSFQQFFDQARLNFDFAQKTFGSDLASLTNDVFRLEENVPLFDENFDSIELYNGFDIDDSNGDGVAEDLRVDMILKDFFNFFSFGKIVTMMGTSDTHSVFEPIGAPGTFIHVSDDSTDAIATGSFREDILAALSGKNNAGAAAARDAVVSNTPFLRVEENGQSVIGSLVSAQGGLVTLHIHAESPNWAEINTVEIFANQIFENPAPGDPYDVAAMIPNLCFTSRANRQANDTCDAAQNGAEPLTVTTVVRNPVTNASVFVIDFDVTIDLDTLPNRGATGDTWLVVRVFGSNALFPFIPGASNANFSQVVELGSGEITDGVFPMAVANAVLVDANGDGQFTAPFAP